MKRGKLFKIVDKLYVSTVEDACNDIFLRRYKISHILNCSAGNYKSRKNGKVYKHLEIDDRVTFPIENFFLNAHAFMDMVLLPNGYNICPGSGVLVHCRLGLSRSPTIIIAYLMTRKGIVKKDRVLTLSEAYEYVEKRRGCRLEVNYGFFRKLYDLEKEAIRRSNEKPLRREISVDYREWLVDRVCEDLKSKIDSNMTEEDVKEGLSSSLEILKVKENGNGVTTYEEYLKELEKNVKDLRTKSLSIQMSMYEM